MEKKELVLKKKKVILEKKKKKMFEECRQLGLDTNQILEQNCNTNPAKQVTKMEMVITNVEKKLHVPASDLPSAARLNNND